MIANRRTWSTVVVTAVAVTGALLQPAAAGASPEPSPAGPGQPGRLPVVRAEGRLRDAAAQGRRACGSRWSRRTASPTGAPPTDDVGAWNANYQAVYQLSFSGLTPARGSTRSSCCPRRRASSPGFIIGDGTQLYRQLVDNSVRYFTSERDGPDVVSSVLDRQPANLTDEKAYVYADPRYDSNDNLLGTLKKTGGPVDVSGGWFDAGGGYEKFAYTASYADALMLLRGARLPELVRHARSRRRRSACSGSPSCGIPPARCSTPRSASAPATPATRSRATTTSGSCPSRRTG